MKVICIEEHVSDEAVETAARADFGKVASFLSSISDEVTAGDGTRPQILSLTSAAQGAADIGDARLQQMDDHGIDVQVLALGNTGATQFLPADSAAQTCTDSNNRLADLIAVHPNRFRAFAALPWSDPEAAASELRRTVSDLGFVGAMLCGNVGNAFLDDSRFDVLLAAFAETRVPLYLHPNAPIPAVREKYYDGLGDEVSARLSAFGWGWHNEAGIHAIRLILSGAFDRHPDLQVISGHWGEMVPFFLQRIDDAIPLSVSGLSRTVTQTYREHFYVTPSGMVGDPYQPHFRFIYDMLGPERIMYSVDYPYVSMSGASEFLLGLDIPDRDRDLIAHGNAERLLRL
ncbi:amidohydrolase family protein [Tsukamurella spumae]|uniref:Amidohydrolase n=1 Tax=Tsukamurella spumae TaxID=44753 RepID=A0A846X0V7_9ACTN|nr:amidohydrolase family protein [Tsukamurella spumae]NKY19187.1 amidohydrolase [Tsukamurella spumae]